MRLQKINLLRLFYQASLLLFTAAIFDGCSKEMAIGDRFSLTNFNGAMQMLHADTSVTFSWEPALKAWEGDRPAPEVSYEITIAKDAEFVDADAIKVIQDSLTFTIGKETLTPFQNYYARVRTVATPTMSGSSWVNYVSSSNVRTFSVLPEISYFKPSKVGDIIDDAARLRWVANSQVTSLVVISESSGVRKEIELTDEQKKDGLATVSDLPAGERFRAELYLKIAEGTLQRRGRQSFNTKPDVTGAGYTDLRGSADPLVLVSTLPGAAPGTKLVLKRGMTYTFPSSYRFDRSVTIMSEPGFGDPAQIQIASSLNVQSVGTIDSIKFDDVMLTSSQSGYVFNIAAEGKVGKIEFENCIISNHKGVARITATTNTVFFEVTKFIVNNCIIQDLNDIGVACVGNANANAAFKDIEITNSTIVNSQRFIYNQLNKRTNHGNSCIVNNVTFYNVGSGRFYDLMNDGTFTGGLTISNSLVGVGTPYGDVNIRGNASMAVTVANSFVTSDVKGQILNILSPANISSSVMFQEPAQRNFTIRNPTFNAVGDPRWRP